MRKRVISSLWMGMDVCDCHKAISTIATWLQPQKTLIIFEAASKHPLPDLALQPKDGVVTPTKQASSCSSAGQNHATVSQICPGQSVLLGTSPPLSAVWTNLNDPAWGRVVCIYSPDTRTFMAKLCRWQNWRLKEEGIQQPKGLVIWVLGHGHKLLKPAAQYDRLFFFRSA